MKKMLTVILAGSMLVGLTGTHDAEAGTKLNLLSKSTISKAKAGKLTLSGLQLGKSIGYYKGKKGYTINDLTNSKNYKSAEALIYGKMGGGFAHFTSHRPINKRYITQLTYSAMKGEKYSPTTIRKYYGKPLTTMHYGRTFDGSLELTVDYYKNVRFQYLRDVDYRTGKVKSGYKLFQVQLTKSPTMSKVNGWKRIDKKYGVFSGGPMILHKSEW
ncbi:hypothetical protein BHU61_00290 [Macrococcus epidermidis]|uniref:Uncharacterized protein n=1 Tax=Macrococcus epidermidis TaxID=1902580 RepID=A0A327ZUV1_9STAP|nr:hypothetical protein [Macrococcus epidermidis]RAK45917.1 hypothetical protein BHU61_00290 [Macrococcus epidermidis]